MLRGVSIKQLSLFVLSIIIFSTVVESQVVINEFSCSNYSLNIGGDNEDFIEFYNPDAVGIDIGGYFLSDNPLNPTKFEIPAGTMVPAGGYLLVICSGEGELLLNLYLGGNLNTNFKINQCAGESIVFSDETGSILEQYTFISEISTTQANHSWAREVDGSGVWSICTTPSPEASNVMGMFSSYAPTPMFSDEAGFYTSGLNLAITVPPGYEVRYTTDGYEPTASSTLYSGEINIANTTVIRAITIDPTGVEASSFITTNTYFTGADLHTITVVSISGDNLETGAWPFGENDPTHIEFFNSNGTFRVEATGDSNEHGNDSNAYSQRGFDYITRDQMGYDYAIDAQLFHVKQRDKYQRLIFKAAANDNYPFEPGAHIRDAYVHTLSHLADLHLDERTSESCIVYINGQYWGVYEYREKVDDVDFTTEYYNQPRHFVDFLKTWGGTWEEYGSGDDWYTLINFATTEDMTVAANYDYVESQLNPLSLIDYFILNSYVVCVDWLNWNTAWWRGRHPEGSAKRWRYALWDMDATFGHYINYTGVQDPTSSADPCNPEALGNVGGQGHVPLLNALMDNETFYSTYINRWADLGNTYFTCDYMNAVLDSMVLVIEPEMPRQCERWGGDVAGWQSELQELRDFIDERCESELMSGMEDCYDVTAVTLEVSVVGLGDVGINTINVTPVTTPFSGSYFEEITVNLEAQENYGDQFLYWEIVSGSAVLIDETDPNWDLNLEGDLSIIAHFGIPAPPEDIVFNVEPEGAGSIVLDGEVIPTYPSIESLSVGNHSIEAVGFGLWWEFSHWSSTSAGNVIDTDVNLPNVNLNVSEAGSVTAHFIYIDHTQLEVTVEPAGAGSVTVVNTAYVDDYWTSGLILDSPLIFRANAFDQWEFDRWEVQETAPFPNATNSEMTLDLEGVAFESVTAVFKEIDFRLFIPNAFTPDNDGVNDNFLPLGQGFTADSYRFTVINRWGEIVFDTTDPSIPWIGQNSVQGGDYFVPDGVYMYTITALGSHDLSSSIFRGSVTLVR
ncbi:MAG: hypothetical protein COA49_01865 [Bacteroidetes bacterium]|nr:MAG: hypothetical protein COA49_01865 [Bacteroidota bacterium]